MRYQTILQAVGPLLIVAAGMAGFTWLKSLDVRPATSPNPAKSPLVRTRMLGAPREQFEITVGGRVVPSREVTLSAEVSGQIVARPAALRAGRHVTGGTLLLQLDPTDYELKLQEFDSQLDGIALEREQLAAETRGIEALAALAEEDEQLASRELDRKKTLLESGAATPADRDRARRELLEARNTLRELENRRDLLPVRRQRMDATRRGLVAQRQRVRRDLDRTRIVAPFDGLLTLERVEVGDFVRPGDVLLKIEEAAVVEVACQLRDDDLRWLRDSRESSAALESPGNPFEVPEVAVTVSYRESPSQWTGRLTRFQGQGFDPQTRTIPCRVIVERQTPGASETDTSVLIRGMFVTVTLPIRPQTRLIEIPSEALRPDGQVWSVTENRLVIHRVQIARTLRNSVLVRAELTDLKPEDVVVISPLAITYDGMSVQPVPVPTAGRSGEEAPSP